MRPGLRRYNGNTDGAGENLRSGKRKRGIAVLLHSGLGWLSTIVTSRTVHSSDLYAPILYTDNTIRRRMGFNQDSPLKSPHSAEAGLHKPCCILIPAVPYQLTKTCKDAVAAQQRLRGTKVLRPVDDLFRARHVRFRRSVVHEWKVALTVSPLSLTQHQYIFHSKP